MAIMLVLLLASALLWMTAEARRPQPAKARRNMLQEDVLAAYAEQRATR